MAQIICTSTGTVLDLKSCVLVPDGAVSEEELDSASDSEIATFALERGVPLVSLVQLFFCFSPNIP